MKALRVGFMLAMLAVGGCQRGSRVADAADAHGPTKPDTNPHLAIDTMLVRHQCSNCHAADYVRVGPPMETIKAAFAQATPQDVARLRASVLNGSTGKWGEAIMPPQKQINPAQAAEIVDLILHAP